MSTTRYVITDDVFRPDSLSSEHWVVQEGSHDIRRTSTPLVYDTLEEARDYVEYIRFAAKAQARIPDGSVLDTFSTPVAVTVFYTNGDIRVVRVVPFTTEILSAVKVEEA